MGKVFKSLWGAVKAYAAIILFIASIAASVCCFENGNTFQVVCGIVNLAGTIIVLAVTIKHEIDKT